jgi:hypothetical protein
MAKNQTSNEKVAAIAQKVLDGKTATPEETRVWPLLRSDWSGAQDGLERRVHGAHLRARL